MKRTKFTDAQIAFILQQADQGSSVKEVCRKAGIVLFAVIVGGIGIVETYAFHRLTDI